MAKKEDNPPFILQRHQLIQAVVRSDEENAYYIESLEGCLFYEDLNRTDEQLEQFHQRLKEEPDRFHRLPILSSYEKKQIIEGYLEIAKLEEDTKAKIPELLQTATAAEAFWDYIKDNPSEVETWTQYYNQRMTVWAIKLLRSYKSGSNKLRWVFEEDLMQEVPSTLIEEYKASMFSTGKVSSELKKLRALIVDKAEGYYKSDATVYRSRRGRPPKVKETDKVEVTYSNQFYSQAVGILRQFVYYPEFASFVPILFASQSEQLAVQGATLRGSTQASNNDVLKTLALRSSAVQSTFKLPVAANEEAPAPSSLKISATPVQQKSGGLSSLLKAALTKEPAAPAPAKATKVTAMAKKKKEL